MIGGFEAPRRLSRRRAAAAESVDVTCATVIGAEPHAEERQAQAWMERADGIVADALAVLNRALHARRIAAADPYGGELAPRHALVTRVGYGTGAQVAEGRWTVARELTAPRDRPAREAALRPQERFAALLSGRDVAPACELLALRARLDLDQARAREAALQTEAALGAALTELEGWRELPGMPERLDELRSFAAAIAAAGAAARAGALDNEACVVVEQALGRLEAALRARTAGASF